MGGLKSGSQDDPFAEKDENEEADVEGEEETRPDIEAGEFEKPETKSESDAAAATRERAPEQPTRTSDRSDHGDRDRETERAPAASGQSPGATTTTEAASYLERRSGAKDERELIQFFLRPEVMSNRSEHSFRADLAERLDINDLPGKFDTREAMVAVAQKYPDEVAEKLAEMGY